jgi:hypothetical protein
MALSPISDEAADSAEGEVHGLEFEMKKSKDNYDGFELEWLSVAAKQQAD